MTMPSNSSVSLLGRGGHTFCNSSFGNERNGFPGAISIIGGALSARAEAKQNWIAHRNEAVQTNNHMLLPNGKHRINGLDVSVTSNNIIYRNRDTGERFGIVKKTGETYSFSGL